MQAWPVGFFWGPDGSASNDAGNLVAEPGKLMLLQRLSCGPTPEARGALE